MKKRLLIFTVVWVVFGAIIYSCTKDLNLRPDKLPKNSLSLSDARAFFETTYEELSVKESRSATFDSSNYSQLDVGDFTPLWNQAISTYDQDVSAIDAPIISQQEYDAIIKTPHDSIGLLVNTTQRLAVIKNLKSGEMTTFIAIRIPDSGIGGHNNCSHIGREFSGVVLFKSLNGHIEQVARYRDGQILENVNIWESVSKEELEERVNRITSNVYLMPATPKGISRAAPESGGGGGGGSGDGHPVVYCPKCQDIHILDGTCIGSIPVVTRPMCYCCGGYGHYGADCPMNTGSVSRCKTCAKPVSECPGHNNNPGGGGTGGGGTGGGGSGGSGTGGSGTGGSTPGILPNKSIGFDKTRYPGYVKNECDCKCVADKIMRVILGSNASIGSITTKIQLYLEDSSGQLYKVGDANAIFNTLNSHIDNNRPITVGVNHSANRGINEGATDHFVVIAGRGYDASRNQYYYNYIETSRCPGKGDAATTDRNRLYYDKTNGTFKTDATAAYRNRTYTITQIRPN